MLIWEGGMHGKCSQFPMTILGGSRDARALRNERMNLERTPRTSDDFVFGEWR